MDFIRKLSLDTQNGKWDAEWGYKDGSKTYTFTKAKHYLSGLIIPVDSKDTQVIFPNGYGIFYDNVKLKALRQVIEDALLRRVEKITSDYSLDVQPITTTEGDEEKDA